MIDIKSIGAKLKEQWRPYHHGTCHILSKGDKCECHLCLIDNLLTELEKRDKMEKYCKHESYETMPAHLSDGRIVDSLHCKCCICGEYIDNPTTGERG